ncbi:hypothetical protein [Nonomuraea indica]|uniref:hypothetical protein n=1 Tax=Nonomuraea indica TaxID=1581193 RepID=UPI0015DE5817|nr:hypothetical protein [Nonomuraea indica]
MIDMVVGAAMYRMLIDPASVGDPAAARRYLAGVIRQADRLLRPPGRHAPDPPDGEAT